MTGAPHRIISATPNKHIMSELCRTSLEGMIWRNGLVELFKASWKLWNAEESLGHTKLHQAEAAGIRSPDVCLFSLDQSARDRS